MNINEEFEVTIEEFQKIISLGGSFEIETPQGWKNVSCFYDKGVKECYRLVVGCFELICSYNHLIMTDSGWKFCSDLLMTDLIETKLGFLSISSYDKVQDSHVYDITVDSFEHSYYSNGIVSHNSGKTSCIKELVADAGFARYYRQNGLEDMTTSHFKGGQVLSIDEKSMQGYVRFQKGVLYLAMIHGTELDENGDQILYNPKGERVFDSSGEPKVVGQPALYILDEFSVVPPSVLFSVFNPVLEIPPKPGHGRMMVIDEDGGRVVKSHPGFAVVWSGNLNGKGIETADHSGFTAQDNRYDDSTLDRIHAVYEFGFNLEAEAEIARYYLGDEHLVNNIIKFTENIRRSWCNCTVETLLTTRGIYGLCEQYNFYNCSGIQDPIHKAFNDCIFNFLRPAERQAWKTAFELVFGVKKADASTLFIPRRSSLQI